MTGSIFLLAAAEVFDPLKKAAEGTGFDRRDALIVTSVGVGVGVLLFVWAYFRYRKKEGNDPQEDRIEPKNDPAPSDSESGESQRRRRRKRRRRRDHRPRNPSLQQTGGLPPQRPEDQLPKD